MLNLIKKQIHNNFTDGVFDKKYIIIHETDNEDVGANAEKHFEYWDSNPNAQASATIVVDDSEEIQMMDLVDKSWAIGVIYGDPATRAILDATNANTINIEICVNADGDYMKARQNAIEVVKYLMPITGIPASNVIRHFDACNKWCPRRMMDNPALWVDFKSQIVGGTPIAPTPAPASINPVVPDNSVKDLQYILNRLGFKGQNGLPLVVDGLKGVNTTFATKACQKVLGLVQDGIAGSITLSAMQQILLKPLDGVVYPHYEYATRYIQYRVGATVDGKFGNLTAGKVKTWQTSNGLVADGVVGTKSWVKLIG